MNGWKSATKRLTWVHAVSAGIVAGIGLAAPEIWFLTPLGLSYLFYTLWFLVPNVRSAALSGFLFGLITSAASVWWFWDALPLWWLGFTSTTVSLYAVMSMLLVLALPMSIIAVLIMPLLYFLRHSVVLPLAAGAAWIVYEELRMWMFSLVFLGPGAALGPHFSVAALGYTLVQESHLLQLAHPFGISALSFVIALIATVLALAVRLITTRTARKEIKKPVIVGLVLFLFLTPFMIPPPEVQADDDTVRIAVVATNFGNGTDTPIELSALLDEELPDVVVFPEGFVHSDQQTFRERHEEDLLVVRSEFSTDAFSGANSRVLYESTQSGIVGSRNKQALAPVGEYMPYVGQVFLAPAAPETTEKHFERFVGTVAERDPHTLEWEGLSFRALVCMETFSPYLFHSPFSGEEAPDVLMAISNPGWFHGSQMLHNKTLQIARVHAVQHRAHYVQATNMAPAFAIAPTGRVISQTDFKTQDVLFIDVPRSSVMQ